MVRAATSVASEVPTDIRDLRIEDLLGRRQVQPDLAAVRGVLAARRVLVTGAGGSIGSEIIRQVAPLQPSSLFLLDQDETHLHHVLREVGSSSRTEVVVADIRDRKGILAAFMEHRPEIVVHAAANKYIHLLEEQPDEALATNILGTANVAEAALLCGTDRFVLTSTHRAVRPQSVMGASKWLAEQMLRTLGANHCIFSVVRFGNVLGSQGSVLPRFLGQIESGGPVTVADSRMARYFMSLTEAAQLVLQAIALAEGGDVFTLDMGEAVNILDLARKVIALSGREERDVEIAITGARRGEELVEDVFDPEERPLPSRHPGILVSHPPAPDAAQVRSSIRELQGLAREERREALAARIIALTRRTRESVAAGGAR
jgi:FlaA1/EpsC-like NDP-sugar epimerase